MKTTLLLSGGGMRGLSFIGAYKALEEAAYLDNITNLYGVSIGSFFAMLVSLGYTSDELEKQALQQNFQELSDINIKALVTKFGIDTGRNIVKWIEKLVLLKNIPSDIDFLALYQKTQKKLVVFASNIMTYELRRFDYEASPKLKVIDALRMSMSIPFVFTPKKLNGDIHVDGALINSFPVEDLDEPIENCICLKLSSNGFSQGDLHFLSYALTVFRCAWKGRKKDPSESSKVSTVEIPTDARDTINFSMSEEDKRRLIEIGYTATKEYLERLH
jgi:NTE family protein